MTINFRRNALQLSVAALFSSAFMANAANVPQVKVTVTDKQCEPMTITVNAGKTQFIIQNHSQKALEWEILKGVMVVEEETTSYLPAATPEKMPSHGTFMISNSTPSSLPISRSRSTEKPMGCLFSSRNSRCSHWRR